MKRLTAVPIALLTALVVACTASTGPTVEHQNLPPGQDTSGVEGQIRELDRPAATRNSSNAYTPPGVPACCLVVCDWSDPKNVQCWCKEMCP